MKLLHHLKPTVIFKICSRSMYFNFQIQDGSAHEIHVNLKLLGRIMISRRISFSANRAICIGLRNLRREVSRKIHLNCQHLFKSKVVLGIETSCDDTGAAVVNTEGAILGDALHSQMKIHKEYAYIQNPVSLIILQIIESRFEDYWLLYTYYTCTIYFLIPVSCFYIVSARYMRQYSISCTHHKVNEIFDFCYSYFNIGMFECKCCISADKI